MKFYFTLPRQWRWLHFALLSALITTPVLASNINGVGHVILISVDGLRGDFLETRINDSPLLYPNFKRLVDEGTSTFNARTDFTRTNTIPNQTSMLTGRPVSQPDGMPNTVQHGYTSNSDPSLSTTLHNSGNPNLSYISSVFDVVHDNGLTTALYASKSKFVLYDQSYNATTGAPDTSGVDNGQDKIDTYVQKSTGSPANASNLNADYLVDMASSQYNYTFLHYTDPDPAGHSRGWGSPTWDSAVQNVDSYLGDLFNLIETSAGLAGDTTIILTADHGGSGASHGTASNPANYTVPVFVWGPDVTPNTDLYALNPTNRLDPGAGRPDYTDAIQPIRNSDTANLALGLLGLGPVPGSLINQNQDLAVHPIPEPSSLALLLAASLCLWKKYNRT